MLSNLPESIQPTVPGRFDNQTMYLLIQAVLDENLEPRARKIELNLTPLYFIEPVGVTVLCNILQWLWLIKGVNVSIHCDASAPTIRYLDDSGFFILHLGQPLSPSAAVRDTTVPLELVSFEHSHQYINDRFSGWLQNRLRMNKDSIASILMSISEIFINIQDHSGQKTGCIFAQHYPNINKIKIAISDFGIGIPTAVQRQFAAPSDNDAILKAVEMGFSTRSTPQNRGVGLPTLIANAVQNNGGNIAIHSGRGAVEFSLTDGKIQPKSLVIPGNFEIFYPGTLFSIILRTDTIEHVTAEEEFTW